MANDECETCGVLIADRVRANEHHTDEEACPDCTSTDDEGDVDKLEREDENKFYERSFDFGGGES